MKLEYMVARLKFNVSELDFSGCKFMWQDRQAMDAAAVLKKSPSGNKIDITGDEKTTATRAQTLLLNSVCDLFKGQQNIDDVGLVRQSSGFWIRHENVDWRCRFQSIFAHIEPQQY